MAKTKDGFYKQMGTSVGSNDYVLLAGGGAKQIKSSKTFNYDGESKEGWYIIAQTSSDVINNVGIFQITGRVSGKHTAVTIQASVCYHNSPSITELQCSHYGSGLISKARIVYNSSTYEGKITYLEVYIKGSDANNLLVTKTSGSLVLDVSEYGNGWWQLVTPQKTKNDTLGYATKEITLFNDTLQVNNTKIHNLLSFTKSAYNLATYNATGDATGLIAIKLPVGWCSAMFTFEIVLYEYNSNGASTIVVSGYLYSSSNPAENGFYNYSYTVVGNYNRKVRLAYIADKCYILLGNTTSDTWKIP
jgi:hypothetical protein